MPKILVDDSWYDAVSPSSLYEDDFEKIIFQRAQIIYPGFIAVWFKKVVQSDIYCAMADFALIDIEYRNWWVVEVEMANHSLENHVLPQVETLANAKYGENEANYLVGQNRVLIKKRLLDMMKGMQPRVLVVVNGLAQHWILPLSKYNAILQIVEIFRSDNNKHIFRINGISPVTIRHDVVSTCHPDRTIPRLLVVESPACIGIASGDRIEIEFEGGMTTWERIDSKDTVWLSPIKRNPLDHIDNYCLIKDESGMLHFERCTARRKK
jgi:hypothetical protein